MHGGTGVRKMLMEECFPVVCSLITATEAYKSVIFDSGVFSQWQLKEQVNDIEQGESGFTKVIQSGTEASANLKLEVCAGYPMMMGERESYPEWGDRVLVFFVVAVQLVPLVSAMGCCYLWLLLCR